MSLITPTTELEAVNECLASIGEAPVNSLSSGMDDANLALRFVRTVSRETQSIGWYFNREYGFTLSPNEDGQVVVPENTLKMDSNAKHLMLRGGKVYDSVNHTYTFEAPVMADLVLGLAFEDLPETARRFIALKACRLFQQRTVGSQSLAQDLRADEQQAWMVLRSDEVEAVNTNIFDSPSIRASMYRGFGGYPWVV